MEYQGRGAEAWSVSGVEKIKKKVLIQGEINLCVKYGSQFYVLYCIYIFFLLFLFKVF